MSDFTNSIESRWHGYMIDPGSWRDCPECFNGLNDDEREALTDEQAQMWDEGSFSWHECESCGSTLGGDRFSAHAIHHEAFGPNAKRPDDVHHIDICADCLMFHANGDEPENWE